MQFICKNVLHVHARRHPQKRCYILKVKIIHTLLLDKKTDNFQKFLQISKQRHIQNLTTWSRISFMNTSDFKKELQ